MNGNSAVPVPLLTQTPPGNPTAATGSQGGAEPSVEPPFGDGGFTGLKFTKAPRYLCSLFQGVPACMFRECWCFIFLILCQAIPSNGNGVKNAYVRTFLYLIESCLPPFLLHCQRENAHFCHSSLEYCSVNLLLISCAAVQL